MTQLAASVHDSKRGAELVDCNDVAGEIFWFDADYVGTEEGFANKSVTPVICEKGFRGHPRSMGGLVFRGIGIIRAKANVAMTNLTYNIARTAQILKYHRNWITA